MNRGSQISQVGSKSIQKSLTGRQKVVLIVKSAAVENIVIFLVIIYVLIVLGYFLQSDFNFTHQEQEDFRRSLNIAELVILILFLIEISLNIIAYGFSFYFRTKLLLFDALVILASFFLVIFDLLSEDNKNSVTLQLIGRVVRAVFRFLRIFTLFRKVINNEVLQVQKYKNQKYAESMYSNSTPSEKVIEILGFVKIRLGENLSSKQSQDNIQWCIDIISKNKLYDPIMDEQGDKQEQAMLNWIKNQGVSHQKSSKMSRAGQKRMSFQVDLLKDGIDGSRYGMKKVEIPQTLNDQMDQNLEKLEFPIFNFYEQSLNQGLAYMFIYMVNKHKFDLFLGISQQKIFNFMEKIEQGYKQDNAYHNQIHASDVLQTTYFFMYTCKLDEVADLIDLEQLSLLLSAAIHDVEHPGTNNNFQQNVRSNFSLVYNDKSVLEMHHISFAFKLLKNEELNIFGKMTSGEYTKARQIIISAILSTDMANHHKEQGILKGRISTEDFNPAKNEKDKKMVMNHVLHSSDISNCMKPWNVSEKWSMRVLEEFFAQGDVEREVGLNISYLMDRYSINTAKSQVGFIDFIVVPTFDIMNEYLPEIRNHNSNLKKNRAIWEGKVDYYEEKLKELNQKRDKQ